ncbi:replication protein RepA [Shewanella maritima]|uniref:replication protein RepA n=1 Tax=Shewanella maritima TaxID=2520507 RepID=UPI003736A0FD
MNLTDLKRKKPKQRRKAVNIDDFIEDANNYAQGKSTLTDTGRPSTDPLSKPQKSAKGLDKKSAKVYRHATFTLTETCITQLNELSTDTGLPKSKLIRILIDDFCQRSEQNKTRIINDKVNLP